MAQAGPKQPANRGTFSPRLGDPNERFCGSFWVCRCPSHIRITPEIAKDHPNIDNLTAQVDEELTRRADPRSMVEAILLRRVM